jgi:hypothetical protein
MHVKIDWLSFTVKREVQDDDNEGIALQQVFASVLELHDSFFDAVGTLEGWQWRNGRKPYSASFARPDGGVAIYVHPRLPHALIEVSGKGCETLSAYPGAADLLEGISGRLTRLDLACDMLTDTRPLEFVEQRDQGRFKAHSEIVSESGETCYIGSRTSNRYARVYRYNEPHERAHLLRCEFVVKAEDARNTALAILNDGHYDVAAALGIQFGWNHPAWDVSPVNEVELKAWRPERREGKTLFWLADTIAPLLVRLHNDGTLDVREWLSVHVLPHVDNSGTV